MTDSSCDSFAHDIPLYVTGDLDDRDTARLDAHLAGCDSCRETLADQRVVLSILRGAGADPELPSDFYDAHLAPRLPHPRWPLPLRAAALITVFLAGMAVQYLATATPGPAVDATVKAPTLGRIYANEARRTNGLSRMLITLGALQRRATGD